MLALKITDIRKFTALLFTEDAFDRFLLHDACFVTAFTTNIEGSKNPDFFNEDEKEKETSVPYMTWAEIRPMCMKLISGKHLPLGFKIVLITSPETTEAMKTRSGFSGCEVSSLSMNLSYQNQELLLTAGISYKGFSMDKSLEKYWEKTLREFLLKKDCAFEEL